MNDDLGDRMKNYENVTRNYLTRKIPAVIRVDGNAFHTFTKNFNKPYDSHFFHSMLTAALQTTKRMQGFKCGYVVSDEVTFVLTDYDTILTQPWFGYNVNKLVSISAAIMTYNFSRFYPTHEGPIVFDSRAFNLPKEEICNMLLWRAKDWHRNSVTMYARSVFSHNEVHNKSLGQLHELLHTKGMNWTTDIDPMFKNGTFFWKENGKLNWTSDVQPRYTDIYDRFVHLFEPGEE